MFRSSSPSSFQKPARMLLCASVLYSFCTQIFAQQSVPDTIAQRTAACVACHGKDGRATSDGYFPRIAGKPAGYLYNQLVNFRDGRRQNAQMTYMVAHMSDQYLKEIADYFASQHLPYPPPQAPDVPQSLLERGRLLIRAGDKSKNIPACVSCHGEKLTGVDPSIPGLLGLSHYYLGAEFGSWRTGVRKAAVPDCMGQIAKQLTPEDITAVASWLASQPVPGNATSAPAGSVKPPIACGSVPHDKASEQ